MLTYVIKNPNQRLGSETLDDPHCDSELITRKCNATTNCPQMSGN